MPEEWVPGAVATKQDEWVPGSTKDEPSIAGTAVGVSRGLVQGVASMPGQFLKIGLAQQRLPEMVIQHFVPEWHPAQSASEYIDQIDSVINKKIQSYGPQGYSTKLGPVDVSGESLGQLLSGAAIPGAVFGKAGQGAKFAGRMWASMKAGASFGGATSLPDVVLAKNLEDANEKLMNAGISIGVGGLLAGALHGGAEAVSKLLSLRRMKAAGVVGGEGKPPVPVEDRWNAMGEYVADRQRGSGGTGEPVEPHLEIKPGLEDAPKISVEEEAKIKAERIRTPAERVADEVSQGKASREKRSAEDKAFVEKGQEYAKLKKVVDDRAPVVEAERKVAQTLGKDADNRKATADLIKQQRSDQHKLNKMNAELEGTAEVIAARGHPVGELWMPIGKHDPIVTQIYQGQLKTELTARIQKKVKALEGSDPQGVADATKPATMIDILKEFKENTVEAGKLLKEPVDPKVVAARDQVLADRASVIQKALDAPVKVAVQVADAYRKTFDPMHELPANEQRVFDITSQSEIMELIHIPALQDTMTKNFSLTERQLPALMNDPKGREILEGVKISPDMSMFMDSIRVAYDKMHDLGVRKGVISAEAFYQDYVNRHYARETADKVMGFFRERGAFQGENPHSMPRFFANLWQAAEHGLKPKTLDIAELIPGYARSLNRTIVHNEIVDALKLAAPDAFKYLEENKRLHGYRRAPDGLLGNAIVEGGVAKELHIATPEWRMINNMISLSKPGNPVSAWNAWNKRITLALDVYHLWQLERAYFSMAHQIPFGKWKEGKAMLNPEHAKFPLIEEAIREGKLAPGGTETTRVEFDKFLEKLSKKDPSIAKLAKLAGMPLTGFSRHLWTNVSPGLTVLAYVKNLETLLADPKMAGKDRRELVQAAAKLANEAMGQKHWAQFGRNRGVEEATRLMVLAPQWLETRFRLFGGGIKALAEIEAANMDPRGKGLTMKPTSPEGKLYAKYWTGYIAQGVATAALGNAMIQSLWPETRKHKEAQGLFNNLTHITFPHVDRNGRPLVMSPFPGLDYILELAHDWRRFYQNRMSPAAKALYHLVSGVDYKGAKDAPASWSFDTFLHVVGDLLPLPMFYASGERVVMTDTTAYEAEKMLFRSFILGLHNHPTFPVELLNEEDFLKNRAAQLKKETADLKNPILKAIKGWQVRRHDADVDRWIDAVVRTEGTGKISSTIRKNLNQLYVGKVSR